MANVTAAYQAQFTPTPQIADLDMQNTFERINLATYTDYVNRKNEYEKENAKCSQKLGKQYEQLKRLESDINETHTKLGNMQAYVEHVYQTLSDIHHEASQIIKNSDANKTLTHKELYDYCHKSSDTEYTQKVKQGACALLHQNGNLHFETNPIDNTTIVKVNKKGLLMDIEFYEPFQMGHKKRQTSTAQTFGRSKFMDMSVKNANFQAALAANPRSIKGAGIVFEPDEDATNTAFGSSPTARKKKDLLENVFGPDAGVQLTKIGGTGHCFWWALERATVKFPKIGSTQGYTRAYGSYSEEKADDSPVKKWKAAVKLFYNTPSFYKDIPKKVTNFLELDTMWMQPRPNKNDDNFCSPYWAKCIAMLLNKTIWVLIPKNTIYCFRPNKDQPVYLLDNTLDDFLDQKRSVIVDLYHKDEPVVMTLVDGHFDLVTNYLDVEAFGGFDNVLAAAESTNNVDFY